MNVDQMQRILNENGREIDLVNDPGLTPGIETILTAGRIQAIAKKVDELFAAQGYETPEHLMLETFQDTLQQLDELDYAYPVPIDNYVYGLAEAYEGLTGHPIEELQVTEAMKNAHEQYHEKTACYQTSCSAGGRIL